MLKEINRDANAALAGAGGGAGMNWFTVQMAGANPPLRFSAPSARLPGLTRRARVMTTG